MPIIALAYVETLIYKIHISSLDAIASLVLICWDFVTNNLIFKSIAVKDIDIEESEADIIKQHNTQILMAVFLYRILDKKEKQQQLELFDGYNIFLCTKLLSLLFFCIKKWEVEKEWALYNYDYNRTTTIFCKQSISWFSCSHSLVPFMPLSIRVFMSKLNTWDN